MKHGETIIILPSIALTSMRLDALVGVKAEIVEIVRQGDCIKGCWVNLPGKYMDETEWYIPYNSIG